MRKRKENPLTEDKSEKKRVCLTLGQKRDVICRLAENKAVPEVAAEFGISRRQVDDIRKHKGKWIRTSTIAMRKTVLRRDERNRGSPQIH